jgi:hypothetical protein
MTTKKQLQSLHDAMTKALLDAVTEGVPVVNEKTGEVIKAPAPAAILNVARQFLKDNNIEAIAVPGSPLKSLVDNLPFAGPEDEQAQRH